MQRFETSNSTTTLTAGVKNTTTTSHHQQWSVSKNSNPKRTEEAWWARSWTCHCHEPTPRPWWASWFSISRCFCRFLRRHLPFRLAYARRWRGERDEERGSAAEMHQITEIPQSRTTTTTMKEVRAQPLAALLPSSTQGPAWPGLDTDCPIRS